MPDKPEPKVRPHPWETAAKHAVSALSPSRVKSERRNALSIPGRSTKTETRHTETDQSPNHHPSSLRRSVASPSSLPLNVTTNFTFLTGASHPEELVQQAAQIGHSAIAITDTNTLAGIVRAHIAAKEAGIQLIVGCRVAMGNSRATEERNDRSRSDPPRRAGSATERRSDEGGSRLPSRGNSDQRNALSITGRSAETEEGEIEADWSANHHPSSRSLSAAADRSVAPSLCVLVYPADRASYGRLCRLLTLGRRRAPKGQCYLALHDLIEHQEGLLAVLDPPQVLDQELIDVAAGLAGVFDDDRFSIAASCHYGEDDRERLAQIAALAEHLGVPMVAANDVCYHKPQRRALQDVLTCIRLGCTLDEAGLNLLPNAERHLKPADQMARLFAACPRALARSAQIAQRAAGFNLDQLKYEYPDETCPAGKTAMQHLIDLTWRGAAAHYPQGVPEKVRRQIKHEFGLIDELRYAPYFLTVHDLVVFARSRDILCQGRGAAANSAVCYCLDVTAVDPDRIDVLFERFVSRERHEPPDIDIDFEHERREEVIQYIYRKYGRDRAALTAEVITYRGRSAVRDVGKALGLSLDAVDRLAKNLDWWDSGNVHPERMRELGLNPADPTVRRLSDLVGDILGFPRHLSQHVGGFVITRTALCDLVPIENAAMEDRTVIEWDKNDIDALGMLKVDVLGLGMLTCVGKCFELIREGTEGEATERPAAAGRLRRSVAPSLSLTSVPPEDPFVYDMICAADTIGVFQIESRAQMSMLPRLRPRCFYDLVIEVAIVRPGPIQGDMVHPYLRRRSGREPVSYPNETIRRVLGKTLGVPLFQEQAMQLAVVAAGFTPGEADQLRRAIAAWRTKEKVIHAFGKKIVEGMTANGYDRGFAERCFEQIKGFSEYGFPESHAASFALIVYVSAWLKKYYPAAFAAALINSQPMGFYAPAQIVRDAKEHGVEVRGVDVNHSEWDCGLEEEATEGSSRLVSRRERERQSALTKCDRSTETQKCQAEASQLPNHHSSSLRRSVAPSLSASCLSSPALRLGMRLIKGLQKRDARAIVEAIRGCGPFDSIERLWRQSGVRVSSLRRLAAADAFGSMGLDRQQALWQVRALRDEALPLFDQEAEATEGSSRLASRRERERQIALTKQGRSTETEESNTEADRHPNPHPSSLRRSVAPSLSCGPPLPKMTRAQHVRHDYATIGLSLRAHPISFIRRKLGTLGAVDCAVLKDESCWPDGRPVAVAGLVLVRQRPGTASGIVFMTIEDESGVANLIVRPKIFDRYRKTARHGTAILARGKVERQGQVVHVMVHHFTDLSDALADLSTSSRDFH